MWHYNFHFRHTGDYKLKLAPLIFNKAKLHENENLLCTKYDFVHILNLTQIMLLYKAGLTLNDLYNTTCMIQLV